MSVSAETYIVISLMFAVFAAVAAVGTSVVLGAGFERLRAGFEIVRKQSGFFADAIYKLDQRTQKLDEETAKLKAGAVSLGERVDRVEKTSTFLADEINSIGQRILMGTPMEGHTDQPVRYGGAQLIMPIEKPRMPVRADMQGEMPMPPMPAPVTQQAESMVVPLFRDYPEKGPVCDEEIPDEIMQEPRDSSGGLTTLLSRYFTGEDSGSGKAVVYH